MEKYFNETKSINTLPSRAYFIPFSLNDRKSYNRNDSSLFTSLNGIWKIEAYESVSDASFFYESEGKDEIPVPSCVQYYGYDYMQYTNVRYPFAYNPPHIPSKNPAYHFTRYFDWNGDDSYLIFEGVDSAFYVYLNGNFVGYSNISHRISEFDISEYVKEKNNKLDVLVLKWNKGSYLEDQDKWRMTGIFRDVYLLSRKKKHIKDFCISTKIDGTVTFENRSDIEISVSLNGETRLASPFKKVEFHIENPKLWSAEIPNLYDMEIKANDEIIYQRIGISESEVKNGIYYFNKKPIKLYGVNRHDFHPLKGYAVSYEDMKKDILLMKSLNINAIRTSHYPSSPLFYELCNEYGMYVMSESDFESHGCSTIEEPGLDYSRIMLLLGSNETFLESILDRQRCNVEEHKNFTCVNIFSMGNESGWGTNFDKALALLKTLTDKPIHYEGLWEYCNAGYKDEYYNVPIDMVSRMYPTPEWLKDGYLNDEKEKRPLVLCEYMHSMGNPGGMKEYWDILESSDRFMGAYVWEWADHGARYLTEHQRYGGDYGEFENDGNFCIDGIVSTDREIKSGTLAMKRAYQPLMFTYDNKRLSVFNKNFFKTEKGILTINGIEHEIIVEPRSHCYFDVSGNIVLKYYVSGYEVAMGQFITEEERLEETPKYVTPEFEEIGHRLIARINDNEIVFDKDKGEIESAYINGEHIGPLQLTIWRAPTDNDKRIAPKWKFFFLDKAVSNALGYEIKENKIIFDTNLEVPAFYPLVTSKITYSFIEDGVEIFIDYKVVEKEYFEYIPRIGFKLKLDKSYSKLKYKAYGPYESYSDSYIHLIKDEYESDVKDEYHPYVKPQESGSHYLPDYMELSNGKHKIYASGMKSFSALPYSHEELDSKKHHEELGEITATYLNLDFDMTGMGTGVCGPSPAIEYRVKFKDSGKITLKIK